MHHTAFLSALAGLEVAQAAAQAALTTLSEVYKATKINYRAFPRNTLLQDAGITSNGGSRLHANIQLEKEELDVEKAISEIIEVQVCHMSRFDLMMKNIQDKLVHFEDLDLLMEKEGQQMEQMKNMAYLQDSVIELLGTEKSFCNVVIEHTKDGSGIGGAVLAASNSMYNQDL
ncbi:SWI/SNF complex subunit SWI3B [Glycine soja]